MRKSRHARLWTGFEAELFDTSGGFAGTRLFPNHNVSMLVGAPIIVTCRCGGVVQRRLQAPGDIDVVPAGFSGAWQYEGATTMLILNVSPSLICTAAQGIGIDPDRVVIQPQLHLKDPHIEHIGWALRAELETDEAFGRLYADSLGLALAAHLLRRYASVAPKCPSSNLPMRRLQRAVDYIHDNLADDLTLPELATVVNMSQSEFMVLFKRFVGMPVHQYVIRCRVKYAMDILSSGWHPLNDVATRAGFSDQSHMARCMRRIAAVTPSTMAHDLPNLSNRYKQV
ncbi:MAG: helix-turn-helix transcriptional regulator [Candidatus Eremiobacteraeota bacterium]|nr:helix-turn-helix transcriptional regulator [Candidatus Eremiobacteraeota bacterium]